MGTVFVKDIFLAPIPLPETNSSPLKIGRGSFKGNDRIPTIHFQGGSHVSFREGKFRDDWKTTMDPGKSAIFYGIVCYDVLGDGLFAPF